MSNSIASRRSRSLISTSRMAIGFSSDNCRATEGTIFSVSPLRSQASINDRNS